MEGFLDRKSISFEWLTQPDFELQLDFWIVKLVIFLRENAIFYKTFYSCFEVATDEKHNKTGKKDLKIKLYFFISIFFKILEPTWVDFGAKLGLQQMSRT